VILKGPSLAFEFYHPREARPYTDLDLLIKNEDYSRAKKILLEGGFNVTDPDREGECRKYLNSVNFFKTEPREMYLDLHWETAMISWNRRPFLNSKVVWENVRLFDFSEMSLPVLQPHLLVLYLSLHLAFHHQFGRLMTLCDLDLVIQKFGGKFDWDEIIRISIKMKIRRPVYYSLKLACSLLETEVPLTVLKNLGQGRIGERFLSFPYLVFREKPLSPNVDRLVKFLLIDELR
jgi:hypothetical protein